MTVPFELTQSSPQTPGRIQSPEELRPTPFRPPRSGQMAKPQRPPSPEGEAVPEFGAVVPGTPVIGGVPVPIAPLGLPPIPQPPRLAPDPNQVYGPASYPKNELSLPTPGIDLVAYIRENDQLRALVAQLEAENAHLRTRQGPEHKGLVAIDDSVVTLSLVSADHLENFQEYLLTTLDDMWERVNARCTEMEQSIHEKVDSVLGIANALKALTTAATGASAVQSNGGDSEPRPALPRQRRTRKSVVPSDVVAPAPVEDE